MKTSYVGLAPIVGLILLSFGSVSCAQGLVSGCNEIAIEGAGIYGIERSRMVPSFDMPGRAASLVDIVPPASQDSSIIRITVSADVKPVATPRCSVLRVPHPLPPDQPNTISCEQSIPDLNLAAVVHFIPGTAPPYEKEMTHILDYLKNEVFSCKKPIIMRGNVG